MRDTDIPDRLKRRSGSPARSVRWWNMPERGFAKMALYGAMPAL